LTQNNSTGQRFKNCSHPWGYEALFEDNAAPSLESILKADPTVIIRLAIRSRQTTASDLADLKAQQSEVR